jgi:hypothetical protein
MVERRIKIKPQLGNRSKVEVEGVDITRNLAGYVLIDTPKTGPRLRLELGIATRAEIIGSADVEITPAETELLMSLGWQPPSGDVKEVTTHEDLAEGFKRFIDGRGGVHRVPVIAQPPQD